MRVFVSSHRYKRETTVFTQTSEVHRTADFLAALLREEMDMLRRHEENLAEVRLHAQVAHAVMLQHLSAESPPRFAGPATSRQAADEHALQLGMRAISRLTLCNSNIILFNF